jgi:hypothetical protein
MILAEEAAWRRQFRQSINVEVLISKSGVANNVVWDHP